MNADVTGTTVRRGLAIGCGGTLGFAWTVGALIAVQEALGWDPRAADAMIGTSAGAELVTMLGSGVGAEDLLAMQLGGDGVRAALRGHLAAGPGSLPPLPGLRPGSPRLAARRDLPFHSRMSGLAPRGGGDASWLAALAGRLHPGEGWLPGANRWLVAMDYESGQRVAFGSESAPKATLAQALQASWAIPGWFPPVRIGGRCYIDGGAASTASADLLLPLGLDELVLLAPMASRALARPRGGARLERLALRNQMSARLDAEVRALEAAGTRVIRLDATDEDLAAMGANMMDGRRRLGTVETALRTCRAQVAKELAR